jgi:hypothetical protein
VVLDDVSAEAVQGEASAGGGRSLDGEIDLATDLLVGLHGRGLGVTRPILVGIDGSEALREAVIDVLDHAARKRCQSPR